MKLRNLLGGQLFAVGFLKLIDIIFHLQSHALRQRHNFIDNGFHGHYLKLTLDNTLRLRPNRSEGSLGDTSPGIFDQVKQGKDVEVIFPKPSEIKTGLFIKAHWSILIV
ncbi:hypothetical protein AVEN_8130-1 [Araneus ventricosus]|uniref:Uncharacterized protein n=1 Tax=Araneus ventricosus TaxID=182803 RepID=A0A4Y2D4F6_ARAVE|nr:hypothetical protein AVEN_8130-1 [Araneus ventricosus]